MSWFKWKLWRLAKARGARWDNAPYFVEDRDGRWVPLWFGLFWRVSRETEYLPDCVTEGKTN